MSVTRLLPNYLMNIDLHPVFGDKYMWHRSYIYWYYNRIKKPDVIDMDSFDPCLLSSRTFFLFVMYNALLFSLRNLHIYIIISSLNNMFFSMQFISYVFGFFGHKICIYLFLKIKRMHLSITTFINICI